MRVRNIVASAAVIGALAGCGSVALSSGGEGAKTPSSQPALVPSSSLNPASPEPTPSIPPSLPVPDVVSGQVRYRVVLAVDPAALSNLKPTTVLDVERHGGQVRLAIPGISTTDGPCAQHPTVPEFTQDSKGRWKVNVMVGSRPDEIAQLDAFTRANPGGGCGGDGRSPSVIEVAAPPAIKPHAKVVARGEAGDEDHDIDSGDDLADSNIDRK